MSKPYLLPSRESVPVPERDALPDRESVALLLDHAESQLKVAVQRISHLDSKANFLLGTSAAFLSFLMGACFLSMNRLGPALQQIGLGWPWYERLALFLLPVGCLAMGIVPTFCAIAESLRSLQTPVTLMPPLPTPVPAVDLMSLLLSQYEAECRRSHEVLEAKAAHLARGAKMLSSGLPWLIVSAIVFAIISGALVAIGGPQ